jgi:HEAT repeat protein
MTDSLHRAALDQLRLALPDDLDAHLEPLAPSVGWYGIAAILSDPNESANLRCAMARATQFLASGAGLDECLGALAALLDDPNPGLRIAALDNLGSWADTDKLEEMARTDPDAMVRRNARHRLDELEKRGL